MARSSESPAVNTSRAIPPSDPLRHQDVAVDSRGEEAGGQESGDRESLDVSSRALVSLRIPGMDAPERGLSGSLVVVGLTQAVDTAVGAVVVASKPVIAVGQWLEPVVMPLLHAAAHPPLVPAGLSPAAMLARLRGAGTAARNELVSAVDTEVRTRATPLAKAVLERIDTTAIVLEAVDLKAIVTAALDSMDLTDTVVSRVDLARVVTAALDAMDLTALVRDRVDLAALADQVIEDVDLPEIIRESSTGVASDVVRGARMGAIAGDDIVAKWVDRVLLRRKARRTDVPHERQGILADDASTDGVAGEPPATSQDDRSTHE